MDYEYDGVIASMSESSSSDESLMENLFALYLLRRRRKRRFERKFSIHPIWKRRREQGVHDNLYMEMAMIDPLMFKEYLRMTVIQYENLLQQVGPKLISAPTRYDVINPSQKLMLTIRYLATGESFMSLQEQLRIGISTIHKIIPHILKTIWETLQENVLKVPNCPQEWQKIIDAFNENWQFPHCWGTMDGKQVVIEAQPNSGSTNFNYKHQHSLNLLAVCDAKYRFVIIDVGAKGRQSDGGVFRNSNFGKTLFNRSLNLPPPSELYEGSPLIPQICVADEAFPLDPNIMRPFPGRSSGKLPNDQKIFNYRLSRARRVIENTFGVMVSQWRIFRTPIKGRINLIVLVMLGAVCLHNFLRQAEEDMPEDEQHYCPPNFVDRLENGEEINGEWRHDFRMDAFTSNPPVRIENLLAVFIREELKKYFLNQGKVSWQQRRVDEGSL